MSNANRNNRLVMCLVRECRRFIRITYEGNMTPEDRDRLERAVEAVEKHNAQISGGTPSAESDCLDCYGGDK